MSLTSSGSDFSFVPLDIRSTDSPLYDCWRAFYNHMRDFVYGRRETELAWQFFLAGWQASETQWRTKQSE